MNRADTDRQLERFARENDLLVQKSTEEEEDEFPETGEALARMTRLGETPAGLIVGVVTDCGTCRETGQCCTARGKCIIILHPVMVVQHITAVEALSFILLLVKAGNRIPGSV